MHNLQKTLIGILREEPTYFSEEKLLKNKLTEDALKLEPKLIKYVLSDDRLKKHFFLDIDGVLIFDKDKFIQFVNDKQFLPDSYTSFKNTIGLVDENGDYFKEKKEVVLAWPYKDCVLEGGQDTEDQKRDEIFYNEILAPDEIDRLFDPKVLTNFKRYDKDGEHPDPKNISINDNLIIKGNNLLALHLLKKLYRGKVNLIYIDPPYNPPSNANTFCYNNNFNNSTWLTFMKNRLDIARQLLRDDGAMIVAIDENEQAYLGVLLEEIFPNHEIHCITIVHNPRGVQGTNFSYTHEYAYFVIPKGKKTINNRKVSENNIDWNNLRNWGGESLRENAKNCFYPIIINPKTTEILVFGEISPDDYHPGSANVFDGDFIQIFPIDKNNIERKWRYARQSVEEIKHLLRARKKGDLWDIEIGKDFGVYKTVWVDTRYDANEYGTKIVKELVPDCNFDFPKSLYNVSDCLYSVVANKKDAIILDFFAGSGTTAHAVLELNKEDNGNRQFIVCEQMEYVETVTKERVKKVIERNKKGDFIYCEIKKWNQNYIDEIEAAQTTKDLLAIYEKMKAEAFFRYEVDLSKFDEKEFEKLELGQQKDVLIECLDKNHLYVNLSEMDDATFEISDEDKEMNRKFYGL